jgi:hypothetical protein
MFADNAHVETLQHARERLVERRRQLAGIIADGSGQAIWTEMKAVQDAIAAVDLAIADEWALAAPVAEEGQPAGAAPADEGLRPDQLTTENDR